jgi:hypothetical protein
MTLLKLKDDFGFDLTFEHSTEAYKIADEVANRNVGCVCMPLVMRIGIPEDILRGNVILRKALISAQEYGRKLAPHVPVTLRKISEWRGKAKIKRTELGPDRVPPVRQHISASIRFPIRSTRISSSRDSSF